MGEAGYSKAAREINFGCEPVRLTQYREEEEKAEGREEEKQTQSWRSHSRVVGMKGY